MIIRARIVLPISRPPLENGAVRIADSRILEVGSWRSLSPTGSEPVHDLGAVVLLPGLINAHCHLDYTDMAGRLSPPRSFAAWIQSLVGLKAHWSIENYAASWRCGAQALLAGGVTTVADIEAVPELVPELWRATPLRVISFRELIALKDDDATRQRVAEAIAQWGRLPAERVGLSPHAPYTTTPTVLRQAAQAAEQYQWPLSTHVAESEEEFLMFTEARGPLYEWLRTQRDVSACGSCSPVQYLDRAGYLSPRLIAAHANFLAPSDAELLARRRVSVVHCPRSHAYFGRPPFPRVPLEKAGVNLCVGTDSLASVASGGEGAAGLSLLAELQTLRRQTGCPGPRALLRMVTVNPARALGRQGRLGELTPGACADLVAVPFEGPTAQAEEAVIEHQGPVHAVMIDGQWVLPCSS